MVQELRRYVPVEGKAGALRRRFEHGTLGLLEALGIHVVDFWESASEPGELWCLVEWPSEAAMKEAWNAFREDERWLALKSETEADGPLVASISSVVLRRAPFFTARRPVQEVDRRSGSQPSSSAKARM